MSVGRATLVGFSAVVMWALLALFTAASGQVPPFQLAAMSFTVGGLLGVASWAARPGAMRHLRQPAPVWLLGVSGLFGYHFFYFTALRNAPAVEAGLIAYLWPLLIVLIAAMLPGERARWYHFAGALAGFAGTILIITEGQGASFGGDHWVGYGAALMGAAIWSTYSVTSRAFAFVPSDAVTGFCLMTALLSALCHLLLEETVWPSGADQWLAVLGLGLGPVGAAFYAWDHGVKHGDIKVLGAASYMAPLLSTAILVGSGFAEPTWTIAIACVLITGGALLAARGLLGQR